MQTNHPVEALVIALGLIFPGPILFVLLLKFRAQRIYVTKAMSLFRGQPALVHLLILRCLRAANHFCGDFGGKNTAASESATTTSPGRTVAPPTRIGTFQSTPICVATWLLP
jgi:hypothetical protein